MGTLVTHNGNPNIQSSYVMVGAGPRGAGAFADLDLDCSMLGNVVRYINSANAAWGIPGMVQNCETYFHSILLIVHAIAPIPNGSQLMLNH